MTLEVVTFWGLCVLLIGSALAVVLTKNLFHSVLYLALSLTATAGVFLALDAEFLAAVQLLLYAGGVITIVDRPGLEGAVCDCYAMIRDEYRRLVSG